MVRQDEIAVDRAGLALALENEKVNVAFAFDLAVNPIAQRQQSSVGSDSILVIVVGRRNRDLESVRDHCFFGYFDIVSGPLSSETVVEFVQRRGLGGATCRENDGGD